MTEISPASVPAAAAADASVPAVGPGAQRPGLHARLQAWPVRRWIDVAALLVVVGIAAAIALVLHLQRRQAIEAEGRANLAVSRVIAANLERTLGSADVLLRQAKRRLEAGEPMERVMADLESLDLPALGGLAVRRLDATGRVLFDTVRAAVGARRPARPGANPFEALRNDPAAGLAISDTYRGHYTGRVQFELMRRVNRPDGSFDGVVVFAMRPDVLTSLHVDFDQLGTRGRVGIMNHRTGRVLYRVLGNGESDFGADVSGYPAYASGRAREGWGVYAGTIDGVQRIDSHVQVESFPFRVAVGTDMLHALESYRVSLWLGVVSGTVMAALVLALWAVLRAAMRREERRAEEVARAWQRAVDASEAKTRFITRIAHDIRTPLTSLRGFGELLAEGRIDGEAERREVGRVLRSTAAHLNELIDTTLDLAWAETGETALAPEPLDVRALLGDAVGLFRGVAAGRATAPTLELAVARGVPERLMLDRIAFTRIINNLIGNAVKFTEHGTIRIDAQYADRGLTVAVADSGPGIAPDLQERVFQPFNGGDPDLRARHGGSGLGLSLARGLAAAMGGTLTLRSSAGHGATFTLTLPAEPPAATSRT